MKVLIKFGGALLDAEESRLAMARQAVASSEAGHQTVVVHGGGKQLSRYLNAQGVESEFRNGLRVTPPAILDAVVRMLAGSVNHKLVAALGAVGAKAVGLTGVDSGIAVADQLDPELGAVGKVRSADAGILNLLTEQGYLPAVGCIAGGADGAMYNVNADQMACSVAAAFAADQLIFCTDVEGVLDASKRRIPRLTPTDAEALIEGGVAEGGMEAKLRAAIQALESGVGAIRIVRGSDQDIVARVLAGEDTGTVLAA